MPLRLLSVIVVLLAVSGCTGESKGIDSAKLADVVLQPADLPPVFSRFDEGAQISADMTGDERSDPARFGRKTGWKARYRRPGTETTRGPLVIESRVDAFDDAVGAERDVTAFRSDTIEAGWRAVRAPTVGDLSAAFELRQGSAGFAIRFFAISWKHRNVSASIVVNGFEGKIALAEALALARKQQQRLNDAAKGS